jgi:hypothetical protein
LAAPERVPLPAGVSIGRLPDPPIGESPAAAIGGETVAEQRLHEWLDHVVEYGETHNDLAADSTSRLSPYLRFGCLSPLTPRKQRPESRRVRAVLEAVVLARLLLPGGQRVSGSGDAGLPIGSDRAVARCARCVRRMGGGP